MFILIRYALWVEPYQNYQIFKVELSCFQFLFLLFFLLDVVVKMLIQVQKLMRQLKKLLQKNR